MSTAVQTIAVDDDEEGVRLDRWFRRRFPALTHGRLEKLIRSGQIRVDGVRSRANTRLQPGQRIRVPPLGDYANGPKVRPIVDQAMVAELQSRVLHRDEDTIVINKPPGLAVQGGSRVIHHLDGMLDALKFDSRERPRLVHRLDKDTSGVLVLARTAKSAARLTAAFRGRELRKLYWALVVGVPTESRGVIEQALAKRPGRGGEKVTPTDAGQSAVTHYCVIEVAGDRGAWLALEPKTGRTHQLRAHLASIGVPIQGDGKYGGRAAFLDSDSIAPQLHLHAREISFPDASGRPVRTVAPLSMHMSETWSFFGFDPNHKANPFVSVAA